MSLLLILVYIAYMVNAAPILHRSEATMDSPGSQALGAVIVGLGVL